VKFLDYDRVLVLDHGEVVEFDAPATLMGQEGSVFRSMCQRSSDWDELSHIASQHQANK
jgi:ABC-type multidrug transport system fused ATPase/permease subunit